MQLITNKPAIVNESRSHRSTLSSMLGICLLAGLCACQTSTPRIGSVLESQRLQAVRAGDEALFLSDHATQLRTAGKTLPPDKQGVEFYVSWSGPGIELVRFEYRQVGRPDKIASQQFVTERTRSHIFSVVGEEHRQGGAISGWRVSLWRGEQLLAEKKSSLW